MSSDLSSVVGLSEMDTREGGGGVILPYMAYTGTCRWTGYSIGFGLSVLNRVPYFLDGTLDPE